MFAALRSREQRAIATAWLMDKAEILIKNESLASALLSVNEAFDSWIYQRSERLAHAWWSLSPAGDVDLS